jgi:predicted metal-dependent phosphotriesterase family hydrolase
MCLHTCHYYHEVTFAVLSGSVSYGVHENLTIENVEQTIEELKLFKGAGGSTIVDVTSIGMRTVIPCVMWCTQQ